MPQTSRRDKRTRSPNAERCPYRASMGVPVGRAYRAMGWIAKRLAATGESVRGAVACGAGRREARHAPSGALGTSVLAYGSHRRAGEAGAGDAPSSIRSGGFGSPSRRCRYLLMRGLCHAICRLHDALPKLFGLISKHLGLPTDELARKLSEFLRLAHADHPLGKVERIEERFFDQEHGALANDRRLLIHAFGRLASDHEHALESGLALAQILFGDFAHPVHAVGCRLHRSFGILLSEIRWTFGHSFRLLQSWSGLELI